ncbi:MAG: hypothetical protein LAP87_17005 [Acidobacteriia bacterium]|nr:hypothetical protein [Terriglobia bacterium]
MPAHRRRLAVLRHPLTIVFCGSVLSAILVPWISARMNDRKLLNDARLQLCIDILKNSTQNDQMLNSMNTSVNMFLKAQALASTSAAVREKERAQERAKIDEQYHEFDKVAWWWYPRLPTEAKLLRIPFDATYLKDQINQYNAALVAATVVLNGLWDQCVRRDCKAGGAGTKSMLQDAAERLKALQTERDSITGRLVHLFAPREARVQQFLTQQ